MNESRETRKWRSEMPQPSIPQTTEEDTYLPPKKAHGWRWNSGRPLDLYALIVLVLAPGEVAGVFAGSGRLAIGFQLVRSLPILLIALIVTALAVWRPEALAGERPRGSQPRAKTRAREKPR